MKKISKKNGYTIVETMIAISLFLVVVMAGMGALLNANLLHQKSQSMRSIMDNLSFVMEDMSRNMRTGYTYRCYDSSLLWSQSLAQTASLNTPRSCTSGGVIVFEEVHGISAASNTNDQWVYKIETSDGGSTYNIFKSTDGGGSWVQMNPNEVVLNSISGFSVLGAEPVATNTQQPFIVIKLVGTITFKNVTSPFSIQTSVSQRLIDI